MMPTNISFVGYSPLTFSTPDRLHEHLNSVFLLRNSRGSSFYTHTVDDVPDHVYSPIYQHGKMYSELNTVKTDSPRSHEMIRQYRENSEFQELTEWAVFKFIEFAGIDQVKQSFVEGNWDDFNNDFSNCAELYVASAFAISRKSRTVSWHARTVFVKHIFDSENEKTMFNLVS